MSPTLSHSRLFKATRRFIVAEITLIVVIVILFAWSTYVLFKLFAGDSDSLFGFSVNTPANNVNKLPSSLTSAQDLINDRVTSLRADKLNDELTNDRLVSQSRVLPSLIHGPDLKEQLASYKSQILKELLARQQRLLSDHDGGGQLASLLGLNGAGSRSRSGQQQMTEMGDQIDQSRHLNGARLDSNLVYLNNAPSLMQLSPSSAETQEGQTTIPPPDPETSQDENGSEPFDEAQPSRMEGGQLEGPPKITTTTEQSPVLSSDVETTTLEPVSLQEANENEAAQDASQTTTLSPDPSADQSNRDSGKESDTESEPQNQSTEDEASNSTDDSNEQRQNEPADDEERAQRAVKTIDEEVDRMTQPSLGVASRQNKPANFLKSTVQFDDALAMSLDDSRGRHHLEPPRPVSPKTIPKSHKLFDDDSPPPDGAKTVSKISTRRQDPQQNSDQHQDLLTADNFNKSPPISSSTPTDRSQVFDGRSRSSSGTSAAVAMDSELQNTRRQVAPATGTKLATNQKQNEVAHFRQRRAAMDQMVLPKFEDEVDSKATNSIKRRADGDDAEEEEEEEEEGQEQEGPAEQSAGLAVSPIANQLKQFQTPFAGQTAQSRDMSTSEPTLEDLLAHKQLLDSLQQNMPPPPPVQLSSINRMKSPTSINPSNSSMNKNEEPQSADTHYSVDHGLLLYPAADEEHHHSSKSHKSHKASKKKDKKKMTMAVKKGGHKSKKHKKEEKKYHKEKKFKGAKKGKKMKKGKGGKGGKKGKKLFKDKGYKKKGFKNTYVKNEFGSKKSYFDEFRDKDFKKKWKNFDDKYNYAQMKKWQAKDVKKAKKMKDHGAKFKKYDKGKWKKQKFADMSSGSKKSLSKHDKDF